MDQTARDNKNRANLALNTVRHIDPHQLPAHADKHDFQRLRDCSYRHR